MKINKTRFSFIFLLAFLSLSCAVLNRDIQYYEAVEETKAGNINFAFLRLKSYIRDNPDSIYAPQARFAICEYYIENNNYRDAIEHLARYILDYPEEKNIVFAEALLYKTLMEYKGEPQFVEKIKEKLFSKSIFLLFSDSKIKRYKSIFNNTYKIVDYIDKIEVFKNDGLFLKITP